MEYWSIRRIDTSLMVCVLLAFATRLTVMAANGNKRLCYDWKGNSVEHGAQYIPNIQEPCLKCTCDDSYPIMCQAVSCHPPDNNCVKWVKIESECCVYKCLDPPGLNPDLPGQENSTIGDGNAVENESITNLGLRLVASTVTSFLVLALLLFMVHRLRQRRLLLAMRRFEAQARRQQMEESESDPYIPDTYLGMIECPPYEDPPPPYSSPKPHPRILPGESPPPYEEVAQNSNNNNINHMSSAGTQGNVADDTGNPENQNGRPAESQERSSSGTAVGQREGGFVECQQMVGRVVSAALSKMSAQNPTSNHEPAKCGVAAEANHANSIGHVSSSTDSTESSHNCSCDSEQTLLKNSLTGDHGNSRSSQSLPPGFCLGQERSKGRKPKHHSSSPKTSRNSHGQLNPGADESWSPVVTCRSSSQDAQPPDRVLCEYEVRQSGSAPRATLSDSPGAVVFLQHPLTEELADVGAASNTGTSPTRVVLRECKFDSGDQEQLRKSLPPLDLSVGDGGNADTPSNQHRNSHEYLRSIRLSNLLSSPNSAFENGVSLVSPSSRQMQRSHSMISDVSTFSVCSETGEKRASRVADKTLRNDSQYPDIPVSAHAMRMAAILQHTEGQGHPQCESGRDQCRAAGNSLKDETVPSGEVQVDSRRLQSNAPECSETSENPTPSGTLEIQTAVAGSAGTKYNQQSSSPRTHQSKKRDKHKQNRHSTGSILQSKPKKHSHPPSITGHLPPSPQSGRASESAARFSPGHVKKSAEDNSHGSPGNKPASSSPRAGAGKVDSSKKKVAKPECDSYKQYGFIDEPSFLQTRNGVVELRLVDPDRSDDLCLQSDRKLGTECQKTVKNDSVNCKPKANANAHAAKLGSKRHLTSADKSAYSPSPTRQKSSRPRSYVNPSGQGEGSPSLGYEGSHSPSAIHYRKSRSPGKSKKRVSYPVVGPDASHNALVQLGTQCDTSVTKSSNPEIGQISHPLGFITVRNGPLSSYV